MNTLTTNDIRYVVSRLPRDIRELLTENARALFVGGGFIRETIAGHAPADIDLFSDTLERCNALADLLVARRNAAGFKVKKHVSRNAITLLTEGRLPIQFITRWTFSDATALVASFDFTVCQAAIWRSGKMSNDAWKSCVGEQFYVDLAGRRLVYTSPRREEEAGGSLLRAIKFVKRGYSIQVSSLGAVIARLSYAVRDSYMAATEAGTAQVLTGLLREVDPLQVVDGLEVIDNHDSPDAPNA